MDPIVCFSRQWWGQSTVKCSNKVIQSPIWTIPPLRVSSIYASPENKRKQMTFNCCTWTNWHFQFENKPEWNRKKWVELTLKMPKRNIIVMMKQTPAKANWIIFSQLKFNFEIPNRLTASYWLVYPFSTNILLESDSLQKKLNQFDSNVAI